MLSEQAQLRPGSTEEAGSDGDRSAGPNRYEAERSLERYSPEGIYFGVSVGAHL